MRTIFLSLVVFATLAAICFPPDAKARSSFNIEARASAVVVGSTQLAPLSALSFASVRPGARAETVPAATDANAARFAVGGFPDQMYQISLPDRIALSHASGASKASQILIERFESYPSSVSARISADGTNFFRVGATRRALPPTQKPGVYEGSFDVTVVYP